MQRCVLIISSYQHTNTTYIFVNTDSALLALPLARGEKQQSAKWHPGFLLPLF